MKTIAKQLKIKEFPFTIKDKDGNKIYYENSNGYWWKAEYKDGKEVYVENSDGTIIDNRPKERPCVGKKVTIDGVEYELK